VPVVLRWTGSSLLHALSLGAPSVHVLTNSRALPAERAEALVCDAVRAVAEAAPDAQVLLRGDSTLRGHLLEEYRAVARAKALDPPPVLLLVPALPSAGRVTRGGVHYLLRDGVATPIADTEYAHDGGFSYRASRLLDWAEERSAGMLAAARGVEVPLDLLREQGADAVQRALAQALRNGTPAAVAPDAETAFDLALIAEGLRRALSAGVPVLVRCAPTFAGVLPGTLAHGCIVPPPVHAGAVIICGSYVENTTRQLEHLRQERGLAAIELDSRVLACDDELAERAVRDAATRAREALRSKRVALVCTDRTRRPGTRTLDAGLRIARRLARVATYIGDAADVVIAKGGITSAVTLTDGLGATEAVALGPLLPGVALWQPRLDRIVSYVVVPGTVGGPSLLTELLERLEI
jgi:uncharacterized protein YgbK (DUF1537 family)